MGAGAGMSGTAAVGAGAAAVGATYGAATGGAATGAGATGVGATGGAAKFALISWSGAAGALGVDGALAAWSGLLYKPSFATPYSLNACLDPAINRALDQCGAL